MGWNLNRPKAAFEPPSDFVGGSGGGSSGTKKVLMVGGIGCGVLLLIIGVLFAAGAFKAVSCCNQVSDFAQKSAGAQEYALEFGRALHEKDFESAYKMTSDSYRSANSLEMFTAAFDPYAAHLQGAPRVFNTRAGGVDGPAESVDDLTKGWVIALQFARPEGSEQLLVELDVAPQGEAQFTIQGVRAESRARSLSSEPPAKEVLEVHDDLAAGRYEMAYGRMAPPFKQETDMAAFKGFLDDSNGVMISNDVEITSVEYGSPQAATVMATVTAKDGRRAIVQYELSTPIPNMPVWKVMAISPVVTSDPPDAPAEPEVEIDAGTTDADLVAP